MSEPVVLETMKDPVLDVPPVTEEKVAPEVKTDEVETNEATAAVENAPEKTFTQAELDEIVQKRLAKVERKLERQRIEAETRAKVTQEFQAKPEPAADRPKVDDFKTYDEYQEALTDWKVEQKLAQRERETEQKKQEESQKSDKARRIERQNLLIENGERKYDDFEEVVTKSNVNFLEPAYFAILESEISEDILYYLAKNQDEAKKIAELPAYAQAKEIGKLEDKLSAKKPPQVTKTPKPIDPIGSGSANAKTLVDLPMDEYMKERRKQKPRWAH